jgi:hypothetical protein
MSNETYGVKVRRYVKLGAIARLISSDAPQLESPDVSPG